MPRWRWKSGRISDRQVDLVLTTFENAPDETVRVVAMHGLTSSWRGTRTNRASEL